MDKRQKGIDPTELEIAEACAAIRSAWSPRERYWRSVAMPGRGAEDMTSDQRPQRWQPPLIELDRLINAGA